MTLNIWSFLVQPLSAGIAGMCHSSQLYEELEIEPRALCSAGWALLSPSYASNPCSRFSQIFILYFCQWISIWFDLFYWLFALFLVASGCTFLGLFSCYSLPSFRDWALDSRKGHSAQCPRGCEPLWAHGPGVWHKALQLRLFQNSSFFLQFLCKAEKEPQSPLGESLVVYPVPRCQPWNHINRSIT